MLLSECCTSKSLIETLSVDWIDLWIPLIGFSIRIRSLEPLSTQIDYHIHIVSVYFHYLYSPIDFQTSMTSIESNSDWSIPLTTTHSMSFPIL